MYDANSELWQSISRTVLHGCLLYTEQERSYLKKMSLNSLSNKEISVVF
jgi:hypothetical protein